MSYPINYPTPQGADVQIFYAGTSDWVKPQGCSFVFALLVAAGGNGASGTTTQGGGGGGSGAVMTSLIPAFLMPDQLRIFVPNGGDGSAAAGPRLIYQAKDGTGYQLFATSNGGNASGTSAGAGGTASGFPAFGAACIHQSVGGFSGASAGNSITAVTSTFLTGGAGGASGTSGGGAQGGTVAINYGYPTISGGGQTGSNGRSGISILSNLIVSQGGAGGGGTSNPTGGDGGIAGFGSGGGGGGRGATSGGLGGKGGDGLIVLISW